MLHNLRISSLWEECTNLHDAAKVGSIMGGMRWNANTTNVD